MYLRTVPHLSRFTRNPKEGFHFVVYNMLKFSSDKIMRRNVFLERAKRKSVAIDRPFLDNETFNDHIKAKIESKEPLFVCRYGNSELVACFYAKIRREGIIDQISDSLLYKAKSGPGVFPQNEDTYLEFAEEYTKALTNADLNAYWGNVLMEEYMIDHYEPQNCKQYAMRALEPFQYTEPWTMAMEGVKLLIVHPYAELIKSQYQRITDVFPDRCVIPSCNIRVVKAIQSNGDEIPEGFSSWKGALDFLYNECLQEEFDIALLSCGSYAVPLGSRLKMAGKQAIVMGGMLQLLFGIKGARWEVSRPDIVAMYNEAWIRPGGEYQIKGSEKMVDGKAYW